jgi:hypothetical protein
MRAELPRVILQPRSADVLVGGLERREVSLERRLGVDDDELVVGKMDHHVGT